MMDAAFVVRLSKWRVALLLALSLGFVAIGFMMVGQIGPSPRDGAHWSGWAVILLFGLFASVHAVRLFSDGELAVVSRHGISIRNWANQTIPWAEISDIALWRLRTGVWSTPSQKIITFRLANPNFYSSESPLGKRARINRKRTGGDILLPLSATGCDPTETIAAIERLRP